MANEEINERSSKKKRRKDNLINFTLRVTATDLPLTDENFKIKLSMDIGSEFTPKLKAGDSGPNFNARRVRSILKFVSDDVIKKVVEYIYFKEVYVKDDKPQKLIENPEINQIYSERGAYRQDGNKLASKPGLKDEEERISKIVNSLIEEEGRKIPIEEKSIANIKFEHLSPGVLSVNVQKIINGDMPPPR